MIIYTRTLNKIEQLFNDTHNAHNNIDIDM